MWLCKKVIFEHDPKWKDFLKDVYPVPAKLNIPTWYKNLKHTAEYKTIKGCIPFLDSLTAGYILKIPQDLYINHNVINKETNQIDSFFKPALDQSYSILNYKFNINLNGSNKADTHPPSQLGSECPYHKKNKDLPFYKILNPFVIKTPPGYSTLFVPPLNNRDDRFEIISGIVDTDIFKTEINFPIIINGDKYPTLETVLKRGTPYVQCIPFKRDNWEMEIKKGNKNRAMNWLLPFLKDNYKKLIWKKKKWN